MTKLTDEIKNLIVTELAQFRGYAEVARLVTAETGVAVDRFQVRSYDPTSIAFAASVKWRMIFERVREHYLHSVESVPIAHKAFRLSELQRNYMAARDRGNLVLANATLKQAAKEVGGTLTNERKVQIDGPTKSVSELTSEERRMMATELLRNALETYARNRISPPLN